MLRYHPVLIDAIAVVGLRLRHGDRAREAMREAGAALHSTRMR